MGRRKTIDREQVLRVAEEIVSSHGAGALTIDAVARTAGITKGGVQSCFGTKEAMIDAMLQRWASTYEAAFAEAATDSSPITTVRAHVTVTGASDDASQAKAASLLASLLQTPEHLFWTRDWYRSRIAGLDLDKPDGRRARLAFLATEGAFVLRFFGLMNIDAAEWRDIFSDIEHELFGGEDHSN